MEKKGRQVILKFCMGGGGQRLAVVDYLKAIGIIFVILNHSDLFDKSMRKTKYPENFIDILF